MTRSQLAFLPLLAAIAACGPSAGGGDPGKVDTEDGGIQERIKLEPPEPREGLATAPGCEGVPERGTCRAGSVVKCDVQKNQLNTIPCAAAADGGKACVVDKVRGAQCKKLAAKPAPDATSPCDSKIPVAGYCEGDTVISCSADKKVDEAWQCGEQGTTCQAGCEGGKAWCCGGDGKVPTKPVGTDSCMGIDWNGVCEGSVEKYCLAGELKTRDCTTTGQKCEKQGAVSTCVGQPKPATTDDCASLGYAGRCDGNTVKWCSGGVVQQAPCENGHTCGFDKCNPGIADCCAPAVNECQQLGFGGTCTDSVTWRGCDGTTVYDYDCSFEGGCCYDEYTGGSDCCDYIYYF